MKKWFIPTVVIGLFFSAPLGFCGENIIGELSTIRHMDFEGFRSALLKRDNRFYFAGRLSLLLSKSVPQGTNYGFDGKIPVGGHLFASDDYPIEAVVYGRFQDGDGSFIEVKDKKIFYSGKARIVKMAVPDGPRTVTEHGEFDLNLAFTNPFSWPVEICFIVKGSGGLYELSNQNLREVLSFGPNETKTMQWHLNAMHAGPSEIEVQIFGSGSEGIVWMTAVHHITVLKPPKLLMHSQNDIYRYGERKEIRIPLRNIGDFPANNISAQLILPRQEVTATRTEWQIDQLQPGEEVILTSTMTANTQKDFFVSIHVVDESGQKTDNSIFFQPEKEASLTGLPIGAKGFWFMKPNKHTSVCLFMDDLGLIKEFEGCARSQTSITVSGQWEDRLQDEGACDIVKSGVGSETRHCHCLRVDAILP